MHRGYDRAVSSAVGSGPLRRSGRDERAGFRSTAARIGCRLTVGAGVEGVRRTAGRPLEEPAPTRLLPWRRSEPAVHDQRRWRWTVLCAAKPAVALTGCRRWSRTRRRPGSRSCSSGDGELGQDVLDEVWEGVYVMNPAPSEGHADVAQQLAELLGPAARAAGLWPRMSIFNLGEADDYRVPGRRVAPRAPKPGAGANGGAGDRDRLAGRRHLEQGAPLCQARRGRTADRRPSDAAG